MRLRILVGALLVLGGGFILARGLHYTTRKDVVDLGGVRVSAEEQTAVPPWVGGAIALAGLVLVFAGGSRRS